MQNGPNFCVLKWDANNLKYEVVAYNLNEKEINDRYDSLTKKYPGQKLIAFVSLDHFRDESAKSVVNDIWAKIRKKL